MTAFYLETLIPLMMTQKFSSFGNNDIATLHEDELAKEDIDWDPSVPFTSHTDKGEDIPIKSRRSMRKMMTNRTMYILGCLLFKPRRVSLITNHLFSFAMAQSFQGSLLFCWSPCIQTQCHHIPPTHFSRYSLPSQLLHPLTNSPLKIKATLMHSQKHRHTWKQKLTHTTSTCVHSSPLLMHTHGWRGRGRGHEELTEETLGTFLAGLGCSALCRTRLHMSWQHSLQMCTDGPMRGDQGGYTTSPEGNLMRKWIETQQSSPSALESEHETSGASWDGEKDEDMTDLRAGWLWRASLAWDRTISSLWGKSSATTDSFLAHSHWGISIPALRISLHEGRGVA